MGLALHQRLLVAGEFFELPNRPLGHGQFRYHFGLAAPITERVDLQLLAFGGGLVLGCFAQYFLHVCFVLLSG